MEDLLNIVLRSLVVYLFMVAGIRIFGKNQLSQLNAGDVVLLLLISNAVQNAMVGSNSSLEGGLLAALVLFLTNFLLKKLMFKNPKIKSILESDPVILIRSGKVLHDNLQRVEISLDELEEAVREHGVERIEDVKLSVMEVDGTISVISENIIDQQIQYSRIKRKLKKKYH